MTSIRTLTPLAAVLAVLGAAGCGSGGQSTQEKATSQVCDARDSISKQVNTLKNMTVSTATKSQIQNSLKTIRDDLGQIASAQGDLNATRKDQVQKANQQFATQVRSIVTTLGSTTSVDQAKSQLTAALKQLGTAYEQTFAKVDCSS